MIYWKFILFLILNNVMLIYGGAVIIGVAIGGLSLAGSLVYQLNKINCLVSECCVPYSERIPLNISKLENLLDIFLYGQPLVKFVVNKHLKRHLKDSKPTRPLVLSFNGLQGTGKNFVSSMIAESLFWNGMENQNVKYFHPEIHFQGNDIEMMKKSLIGNLTNTVRNCKYSLFIFDEVHDMKANVLDSLVPFVDSRNVIDGIDYRHMIILLLSNSGGKDITVALLDAIRQGKSTSDIKLNAMETILSDTLYKLKGDGLTKSKLINHSLITAFVPFYPLRKEDVRLCITASLNKMNIALNEKLINDILSEMLFFTEEGIEWSENGCKKIEERIHNHL